MKNISLTIFFLIFFSAALWSKTQKIILTGSEFTGSHIFAKELSRLINLSKKKKRLGTCQSGGNLPRKPP